MRKWHFQIVHHGLWDYDPASAPNLVTITVDGKRIDAVVQLTKQGWAFVFDRVTGRPVWRHVLPRQATATPMTYLAPDGRQFVLIATGRGEDTALVAFTASK